MFNKDRITEIVEYQKALDSERNALEKMIFRKASAQQIVDNQHRVVNVMQLMLIRMVEKVK